MRTPLHFDRVAPGGVTLPFLLAAPFVGAIAAVLLLVAGGDVLQSRWHPALIGSLHVYTIGFLLFSIAGALLQIGPVLSARPALQSERVAAHLRLAIGAGALLLGCGLFHNLRLLLIPALFLLLGALLAWSAIAVRSVGTAKPSRTLLLAMTGLGIGLMIGLRHAAGHAFPALGMPRNLTNLHAAWMLLGGIAPLVMAVGVIVIPMFQHTRPLPRLSHILPVASVLGMLLQSVPGAGYTGGIFAVSALLAFAVIVLIAQWQRRNTPPDATVQLFQLAMGSAIGGVLAWVVAAFVPEWQHQLEWTGAVLLIVGFAGSSVHGMALKIVPFLVRLRLQRALWEHGRRAINLPGFQQLLPSARTRLLPLLHTMSVALLALAPLTSHSGLFVTGIVLLALAQLMLGMLLWSVVITSCRMDCADDERAVDGEPA